MYSQEDFKNAPIMDSIHYGTLDNPIFEGQTRVDSNGDYKMYFSSEGQLFGYQHNIYS